MANDDQIVMVVGDRFCVPYTMELLVKRKIQSFSNAHYDVFDTTGNVLLQIDGGVWNLHKKRVMKDPAGLPVITLREKVCMPIFNFPRFFSLFNYLELKKWEFSRDCPGNSNG